MTNDHNREVEGKRERLIRCLDTAAIALHFDHDYGETCAKARDMLRADLTELETLRSANAALRADAQRYRWLRKRLNCADFAYGEDGKDCIVAFDWPANCSISANLDASIDAALATPNIEETPKGDGTP